MGISFICIEGNGEMMDIEWLEGELDFENYQKLEEYVLCYYSRNDEL